MSSLSIPTATDSKKSGAHASKISGGGGGYNSRLTTEKSPMDFTMSGLQGMKNKSLSMASRNVATAGKS